MASQHVDQSIALTRVNPQYRPTSTRQAHNNWMDRPCTCNTSDHTQSKDIGNLSAGCFVAELTVQAVFPWGHALAHGFGAFNSQQITSCGKLGKHTSKCARGPAQQPCTPCTDTDCAIVLSSGWHENVVYVVRSTIACCLLLAAHTINNKPSVEAQPTFLNSKAAIAMQTQSDACSDLLWNNRWTNECLGNKCATLDLCCLLCCECKGMRSAHYCTTAQHRQK